MPETFPPSAPVPAPAVATPQQTPDLWAVVAPACAAASVGTLAAMLGAVRQINPELLFRWDLLSAGAGVFGAVSAWSIGRGFWRLGRDELTGRERSRLRWQALGGLAGLGLLVLISFAIAAGGLPDERRRDMIAGGIMAAGVIGAVGWTVWRLARLFGGSSEAGESEES